MPPAPPAATTDDGHEYSIRFCLGKFTHVTAKKIIDEMKAGKIFPLVVKQGTFQSEGNVVTLAVPYIHRIKLLPFMENDVLVKAAAEEEILLEALPKHIFQGTVLHKIYRSGNNLIYQVEGKGVPNESSFSRLSNDAFIKLRLWEFFIRLNVVGAVEKLEIEIEKGGENESGD